MKSNDYYEGERVSKLMSEIGEVKGYSKPVDYNFICAINKSYTSCPANSAFHSLVIAKPANTANSQYILSIVYCSDQIPSR